jgi:hypothetical protein
MVVVGEWFKLGQLGEASKVLKPGDLDGEAFPYERALRERRRVGLHLSAVAPVER